MTPVSDEDDNVTIQGSPVQSIPPSEYARDDFAHTTKTGRTSEGLCLWNDCNTSFPDLQQLVEHIHSNHVGMHKSSYTCEWATCNRRGLPQTSRFALVSHIRSHTGEKPFVCSATECDRAFTRSDALAKHMRQQHNISPPPPGRGGGSRKRKRGAAAIAASDDTPTASGSVTAAAPSPSSTHNGFVGQTLKVAPGSSGGGFNTFKVEQRPPPPPPPPSTSTSVTTVPPPSTGTSTSTAFPPPTTGTTATTAVSMASENDNSNGSTDPFDEPSFMPDLNRLQTSTKRHHRSTNGYHETGRSGSPRDADADEEGYSSSSSDTLPEYLVPHYNPETGLVMGKTPAMVMYLLMKAKYRHATEQHDDMLEQLRVMKAEAKKEKELKDEALDHFLRVQFGDDAQRLMPHSAPLSHHPANHQPHHHNSRSYQQHPSYGYPDLPPPPPPHSNSHLAPPPPRYERHQYREQRQVFGHEPPPPIINGYPRF